MVGMRAAAEQIDVGKSCRQVAVSRIVEQHRGTRHVHPDRLGETDLIAIKVVDDGCIVDRGHAGRKRYGCVSPPVVTADRAADVLPCAGGEASAV